MNFTFTVTYDDALVASAAARMWWRRTGVSYLVALLLVAVSEAALLVAGDRSWWTGVIGTVLLLGMAVPLAGFLVQRRGSLQKSRELEAGQAELTLAVTGFGSLAAVAPWSTRGTSSYTWRAIRSSGWSAPAAITSSSCR